jgi:hypothetical protein
VIVWERNTTNNHVVMNITNSANSDDDLTLTAGNGTAGGGGGGGGGSVLTSLASLRESMKKLGLSSDKLKQPEQAPGDDTTEPMTMMDC